MKAALLALTLFSPLCAVAGVLTGTARDAQGEIRYFERHVVETDDEGLNKLIRVEYKNPSGQVFATMTSDFSKNKLVPDTVFEDLRFKVKNTLTLLDGKVVFEEFKNGKRTSKKSLPLNESMVASQGFDNYIRSHSSELASGPKDFKFGVLSKMDFFTLTGYRRPSSADGDKEYGIKVSSWLVRLFADELKVAYDAKTFRLKSFAGRSNIPDDRGEPQQVVISYEWQGES